MKRKISPEDLRLWQAQLKDVKPLSKTETKPEVSLLPKEHSSPTHQLYSLEKTSENPKFPLPLQIFGKKELRHLKVDEQLDLHGMSMNRAYEALKTFLIQSQQRGRKIVLIITGKGALTSENTLRHQVPRWIREVPLSSLIASFHYPAKLQHGGGGAFYIRLRKLRQKGPPHSD